MAFVDKLSRVCPGGLFLWCVIGLAPVGAYVAHRALGLSLVFPHLWSAAWALAAAPLLEEAVFRYLLQDGLMKMMSTSTRQHRFLEHVPNVLASLVFAYAHPMAQGAVFQLWWLLPSLVLGEVWRRHRSYGACVVTHAWFNLCLWWVGGPIVAAL